MGQQRFPIVLVLACWLGVASLAAGAATTQTQTWQMLTPAQQTVLAPVKDKWAGMSATQRARLLAVSAKYPKLKPEQQKRFLQRLTAWSSLTQAQRDLARKNYQKIKQLPTGKRQMVKSKLLKTYATKPGAAPVASAPAAAPPPAAATAPPAAELPAPPVANESADPAGYQ